jgi:cytochrome c-type biogenesis protein CcmH/NrfF
VEGVVLIRTFKGFWIWMIPIALLVVGAITELVKMMLARRERQALIERGIDPDTVAKKAPTLR